MQANTKLRYDKFVSEFIKTGNGTTAAINAGYSKKTARAKGCNLLKNKYVQDRIKEHQEILKENSIADETEILSYFTDVMRGKQQDQVATNAGVYLIRAQIKDRNKAAEMLGKHLAMWTDKQTVDANISPIQIIDDVPEEDGADEQAIYDDSAQLLPITP